MSDGLDSIIACPECGNLMDVSEKICESCGADVGAHRAQYLYLFVGACVLALLLGLATMLIGPDDESYDDSGYSTYTTGGGYYAPGGSHRAGSRGATRRGSSSGGFGFGK